MDRYVICGGERLSGQVKISGAKNAVLPILAGTLMTKNAVLKNVPNLSDVAYTVEILENLGMNITREKAQNPCKICKGFVKSCKK